MTTISTEKARQGRKGYHMLYVLVASLVLAALVWIGVESYGEAIDPPAPAENAPVSSSPPATAPAQPAQ